MKICSNIYLTLILVLTFSQITSQNRPENNIKNKSDADLILEYYGNTLLRSNCVRYAALKKVASKFEIEIGVSKYNCVEFSDSLTVHEIINLDFPSNIIPRKFPFPYDSNIYSFNNIDKVDLIKKDSIKEIKIIEATKKISYEFYNSRIESINNRSTTLKEKQEIQLSKNDPDLSLKDWVYKHKPTNHSIKICQGALGSLGAIFELHEYPNDLFGITNWHVLSGKLNDTVYSSSNHPIGNIFWSSLDSLYEVAFVRFNIETKKRFKEKYNQEIPKLSIKEDIKYTDYGHHYGAGSDTHKKGRVFSNNAHVRVLSDYFPTGSRIFKKQILFEKLSTKGDSGAIVRNLNVDEILNPNMKCLGLIIGGNEYISLEEKTKSRLLTVSNNLKYIFNTLFEKPQWIYDPIKKKTQINIFKLKK